MFGRNEEPIDAAAAIEESAEQRRIVGERGPSTLGAQRRILPAGARPLMIAVLLVALGLAGSAIWKARGLHTADGEKKHKADDMVKNMLPPLAQASAAELEAAQVKVLPATAPVVSTPISTVEQQSHDAKAVPPAPKPLTQAELLEKRRLDSGLRSGSGGESSTGGILSPIRGDAVTTSGPDGELQRNLQPLRLKASAAGLLTDRNYLLTQGAMIDCQLETRIVTTQAGMTSCYATRAVYSTNGEVVLVPRGSRIVGNYQSGIKQGQARIFVLWSRIETPEGVIVALDSPGTGPLGEAGVGGIVDNHFFERFGTAVLVSLIGDVGQFVAGQGQKGNGNQIQFGGTTQGAEQASVEILKSTLNIPPTLYLNQGERVAIFVARDLDFSGVYSLRSE